MAKAKDFTQNTSKVIDAITTATAPTEPKKERKPRKADYTEAERREISGKGLTSGRKGCGNPRINMAFTIDNYEYIKIMSGVRGEAMSVFINKVIAKDLEENRALYESAKAITDKYNQG